jgi:hypothetical protein
LESGHESQRDHESQNPYRDPDGREQRHPRDRRVLAAREEVPEGYEELK